MSEREKSGDLFTKIAVGIGGASVAGVGSILGVNPLVDITVFTGTIVTTGSVGILTRRRQTAREIAAQEYLASPQFAFDQLVGWVNTFLAAGDSVGVIADSFTNEQRIPQFSQYINKKTDVWAVEPGKTVETATPIQDYLQSLLDNGTIQQLPYLEAGYENKKGKKTIGKHIGVTTYIKKNQPEKIVAMASTSTTKEGELGAITEGQVTKHEAYSRSFFSLQQGVELVARTVKVASSFNRLT